MRQCPWGLTGSALKWDHLGFGCWAGPGSNPTLVHASRVKRDSRVAPHPSPLELSEDERKSFTWSPPLTAGHILPPTDHSPGRRLGVISTQTRLVSRRLCMAPPGFP